MNLKQFGSLINKRSEQFAQVVSACQKLLNSSEAKEAREYLNSRVSSFNQTKFQLGYFPPDYLLPHLTKLIPKETLIDLKLAYLYQGTELRGVLDQHPIILPIYDEYKKIIALVGRSILPDESRKELKISKYKYTSNYNKSMNLFGLFNAKETIRDQDRVIIVEGQIDVITCNQYGFYNVIALGGSSLSDYQVYLILKYTENVDLLLDNDEPGINAANKIIDRYSKDLKIRKLELPKGYKDVDLYLNKSPEYSVLNQ